MNQIKWSKLSGIVSNVSPALTTHTENQLLMAAITPSGDVQYTSSKSYSAGWESWQLALAQPSLQADPNTPPVLVSVKNVSTLFFRGADNNLYKTQRVGYDDWTYWTKLTSDGSVRGRISVALTEAAGVQHTHVIYAASDNEVQYRRFDPDGSPDCPPEVWSDALEGVVAADGSYELLALIRARSGEMLTRRKTRPWGGAWQKVANLPSNCLDISNVVFFGGAFHVVFVMKSLRDETSGTYVYFLAHTRFRVGMYDDGYFRVLLEYQAQSDVHPQATLAVYRNKLVAAYTDHQSYVRYAYWDTADPETPWIGMEVVAAGRSIDRPALSWFNAYAKLKPPQKKKANFGNDLLAVVRGMTGGSLWTINFSRAFFSQRIKQIGLAVDWCTEYSDPEAMLYCPDYNDAPPITEMLAFSEVGFGTITLPNWLMSAMFKPIMQYEGDPSGYYYTWIHTQRKGAYLGPHINMDWATAYLVWDHELGHRFATSVALWNDGDKHSNPNLMKDMFPDLLMKSATDLFGKWTNNKKTCKGGADGARCRGFTGESANYDVMDRQHALIMPFCHYMRNGDKLRQLAYDDLREGVDLLKQKYAWIRKHIFRGVEFKKDNEPLPVVSIMNKHSRKALDVAKWNVNDRAGIQQYTFHGGDNQRWALVPDGDGYYQLMAMHSGKCLDVTGSNQQNGAKIQLYTCHGGTNQKWELIPGGDDHFEIVAKHSGKCLDVTSWGTADGIAIQQYERHGGANQKWKLEYTVTF